jgi:tyrosine-protein phosphatase SIW14
MNTKLFYSLALGAFVAILVSTTSAFATGNPSAVTILRFREVTPDIYRGALPETQGMEQLKAFGIKTDLNIDLDSNASDLEAADAVKLGINYIYRPLSGFWAPSDQQVNDILAIMNDPSNYPIFVHCLHGQDRTGLVVGLYRINTQGWSPADAYQEMLADGFHRSLIFLNHYFERRTGFED